MCWLSVLAERLPLTEKVAAAIDKKRKGERENVTIESSIQSWTEYSGAVRGGDKQAQKGRKKLKNPWQNLPLLLPLLLVTIQIQNRQSVICLLCLLTKSLHSFFPRKCTTKVCPGERARTRTDSKEGSPGNREPVNERFQDPNVKKTRQNKSKTSNYRTFKRTHSSSKNLVFAQTTTAHK